MFEAYIDSKTKIQNTFFSHINRNEQKKKKREEAQRRYQNMCALKNAII